MADKESQLNSNIRTVMPLRKFFVEQNGQKKCLEITWKFYWKNIEVKIDNEPVHKIANKKELDKGVEFYHLGQKYNIQMKQVLMSPQLVIEINDKPLPGSSNDPVTMVRNGYYLLFFIMALNLVLGVYSVIGNIQLLQNLGIGYYNIFAFAVYSAFYVISRSYNLFAGLLGIFMFFIVDGVVAVIGVLRTAPSSVSGTVITRIIFGTILFLACKGAYKLQGRLVSHAEVSFK